LFDIGVAPAPEPYQKRTSHGIVLAEDGRKMSKSFGNVINPDEIVKEFGADSLRMYEMFIGPFDQAISWNTNGLKGCYRFLNGLWDFAETLINSGVFEKMGTSSEGLKILNKTIKKVSNDIDNARFNTAVSSLMKLLNYFREERQEALSRNIETMGIAKKDFAKILLIVSPFAPHIAEELWQKVGHQKSIAEEKWPESELMAEQNFPLIIQINGKVRDTVEVDIDINEEEALKLAISQKKIENWIAGKEIKKVIFVPNKLINIVV
ncbi:MAG: class I tRNA ligase family protein, partial [Patescibacteria group bacterium]